LKPWVRDVFYRKLVDFLRGSDNWYWHGLPPAEVERRIAALERIPLNEETVRELSPGLEVLSDRDDLPGDLRERAKRIVGGAVADRSPNSAAAW
jgi:hypothetical protein